MSITSTKSFAGSADLDGKAKYIMSRFMIQPCNWWFQL